MTEYSIKVNGVPDGTTPAALRQAFEYAGFTTISDVYLPDKFLRQGFGFVRFYSQEEAHQAAALEGLRLGDGMGPSLACELALTEKRGGCKGDPADASFHASWGPTLGGPAAGHGKGPPARWEATLGRPVDEHSLWVGPLAEGTAPELLREAFAARGVDSMTDVYIPAARGFGFVRFGSLWDAEQALQVCTGLRINGIEVELKLSTSEKQKFAPPAAAAAAKAAGNGWAPGYDWGPWGHASDAWYTPAAGHGCIGGNQFGLPARPGRQDALTPARGEHSLWVGPIRDGTQVQELGQAFAGRGVDTITDVYIPPGRGFGFVRFGSLSDAEHALQTCAGLRINGVEVELKLSTAEKQQKLGPPSAQAATHGMYDTAFSAWGYASQGGHSGDYWGGPGPANPCLGAGKGHFLGKGPPLRTEPPTPGRPFHEHSVWVGPLQDGTDPEELRAAFAAWGVHSMTDVYIPPGRGFGFVRFGSLGDAERALQACTGLRFHGVEVELKLSTAEKQQRFNPGAQAAHETTWNDWGWSAPGGGTHAAGEGHWSVGAWKQDASDGHWGVWPWGGKGGGCGMDGHKGEDQFGTPGGFGVRCKGKQPPLPWTGKGGYDGDCHSKALVDAAAALPESAGKMNLTETSVWVGSLPAGATPEALGEAFNARGVGNMTDVYFPPGRDFGFVRFVTGAEAREAVQRCKGLRLGGRDLELKLSKSEKRNAAAAAQVASAPVLLGGGAPGGLGPGAPMSGTTLLEISVKVSNLKLGTNADQLRRAFVAQGLDTMTDVYIPAGKTFGFLRFLRLSDAHAAMSYSGMPVLGSEIVLEFAEGSKRTADGQASQVPTAGPGLGRDVGQAGGVIFRTDTNSFGAEVSVKVGNLPADATPEELSDAFAAQGIDSMTDCYIPRGRSYGFIRFLTAAEGRYALSRDVWLRGLRLELEPAVGGKRRAAGEVRGEAEEPWQLLRPAKAARQGATS